MLQNLRNCLLFLFSVLSIFLIICSILQLEAAMSTIFAAFLSSNLSVSMEFENMSLLELLMEHDGL